MILNTTSLDGDRSNQALKKWLVVSFQRVSA